MSDQEILDFSFLKSFLDTKEELLETAEIFERSSSKALGNLYASIKDKNHTRWIEAAHQLKGAASMIGATHMANLCNEAQNLPESQSRDYQEHFDKIKQAYETTKTTLNTEIRKLNT